MNYQDVRIVFLGTPQIAAEGLTHLLDRGFKVVGVVSQPDACQGRGRTLVPSPVSQVALARNIPLHRPIKLNRDFSFVENLHPDLLLTYAFVQILSSKVLALSKSYAPLNIHASDLPDLRGASPMQTALLRGDTHTAVCLMEMVKAMDAGRVFARVGIDIAPSMNFTALAAAVSHAADQLIDQYLPQYLAGTLKGEPQDETKVTICHMFSKSDEYLDPALTPAQFVNRVRAFSLKPGAFFVLEDGTQIKVYQAQVSNLAGEEGRIICADHGRLTVAVKGGSVDLLNVQKQGKKAMSIKDFLNGNRHLQNLRVKAVAEVFPPEEDR